LLRFFTSHLLDLGFLNLRHCSSSPTFTLVPQSRPILESGAWSTSPLPHPGASHFIDSPARARPDACRRPTNHELRNF
jgi:hypothetical protein